MSNPYTPPTVREKYMALKEKGDYQSAEDLSWLPMRDLLREWMQATLERGDDHIAEKHYQAAAKELENRLAPGTAVVMCTEDMVSEARQYYRTPDAELKTVEGEPRLLAAAWIIMASFLQRKHQPRFESMIVKAADEKLSIPPETIKSLRDKLESGDVGKVDIGLKELSDLADKYSPKLRNLEIEDMGRGLRALEFGCDVAEEVMAYWHDYIFSLRPSTILRLLGELELAKVTEPDYVKADPTDRFLRLWDATMGQIPWKSSTTKAIRHINRQTIASMINMAHSWASI